MAPMEFIFDEITAYKSIVSLMSFGERMKIDSSLKGENIIHCAGNENIDLLYITDYYKEKFGLTNFVKGDVSGEFTCIFSSSGLMVWEKNSFLENKISKTDTIEPLILTYNQGFFQYGSSFN